MTRCHGWVDQAPVDNKKRRSTSGTSGKANGIGKTKNKAVSRKQQIQRLKDEFTMRQTHMEFLIGSLAPDGPLFSIQSTEIESEMEHLKSIKTELTRLMSQSG